MSCPSMELIENKLTVNCLSKEVRVVENGLKWLTIQIYHILNA